MEIGRTKNQLVTNEVKERSVGNTEVCIPYVLRKAVEIDWVSEAR